jgi:hypothetical protein
VVYRRGAGNDALTHGDLMASNLTKEERELRTFEALAPLVGINVVPGSIIQDPPPAPDIQCAVVGIGHTNFELVSLDDRYTNTRLSNMFNTKQAWNRALSRLSSADQARVSAEFADVFLSLNFEEMAGTKDRGMALAAIQKELLSLPTGYAGELFTRGTLPARLHGARVFRNKTTDGPHFSAPSAGSWMPPQLNRIEEKLRDKNYTFTGPLELFAYSPHDEPDGHINSLDEIQACINQNLTGSLFTRVHVFHLGFLKHIVTIP